jgi:hypothetical protein
LPWEEEEEEEEEEEVLRAFSRAMYPQIRSKSPLLPFLSALS